MFEPEVTRTQKNSKCLGARPKVSLQKHFQSHGLTNVTTTTNVYESPISHEPSNMRRVTINSQPHFAPHHGLNHTFSRDTSNDHTVSHINEFREPITPKFFRPPYFDASKNDPVQFLKEYRVTVQASARNDMLQLCYFVNSLQGSATVWFRTFAKLNPNAGWDETLKAFKSKFIDPHYEDDLQVRLVSKKQQPNESLLEYYYGVIDLCDEVNPQMAESEVMRRITAGLLPYYRHMINISNPQNLGELDSLIDMISETERVGNVYTSNTSQPPHLKPSDSHTSSIS
ncbi:Retrotransposon gag protein [Popillia japonica]|uniref:Retrotransposon gag protein n=1 Tax=Popillia japonica TaxID=7064 RepID=A0AAW1HU95_POPJA